jgi:hypothetical protein
MSQLVKTKRQANFKDFKRFGHLRGLSNKKTLYLTRSCVNWAFFGTSVLKAHELVKEITILTLEEHTKLKHHSFLRTFLLFFFKIKYFICVISIAACKPNLYLLTVK